MSEKVTLELTSTTHDGVQYGAGPCVVQLGGAPMDGVAVTAGKERRITTIEHAPKWLSDRGLPPKEAYSLLREACPEQFGVCEIPDECCDQAMLYGKVRELREDLKDVLNVGDKLLTAVKYSKYPKSYPGSVPNDAIVVFERIRKRWKM